MGRKPLVPIEMGTLLQVRDGRFITEIFKTIKLLYYYRVGEVIIECGQNPMQVLHLIDRALKHGTTTAKHVTYTPTLEDGRLRVKGDAVLHLTDDILIPKTTREELYRAISSRKCDRIQVRRLFCWDSTQYYNSSFPENWTTVAFCNKTTAKKNKRVVHRLRGPVMDMRFLCREDRNWQKSEDQWAEHWLRCRPQIMEVPVGY